MINTWILRAVEIHRSPSTSTKPRVNSECRRQLNMYIWKHYNYPVLHSNKITRALCLSIHVMHLVGHHRRFARKASAHERDREEKLPSKKTKFQKLRAIKWKINNNKTGCNKEIKNTKFNEVLLSETRVNWRQWASRCDSATIANSIEEKKISLSLDDDSRGQQCLGRNRFEWIIEPRRKGLCAGLCAWLVEYAPVEMVEGKVWYLVEGEAALIPYTRTATCVENRVCMRERHAPTPSPLQPGFSLGPRFFSNRSSSAGSVAPATFPTALYIHTESLQSPGQSQPGELAVAREPPAVNSLERGTLRLGWRMGEGNMPCAATHMERRDVWLTRTTCFGSARFWLYIAFFW